jgi:hypothetical protein
MMGTDRSKGGEASVGHGSAGAFAYAVSLVFTGSSFVATTRNWSAGSTWRYSIALVRAAYEDMADTVDKPHPC